MTSPYDVDMDLLELEAIKAAIKTFRLNSYFQEGSRYGRNLPNEIRASRSVAILYNTWIIGSRAQVVMLCWAPVVDASGHNEVTPWWHDML